MMVDASSPGDYSVAAFTIEIDSLANNTLHPSSHCPSDVPISNGGGSAKIVSTPSHIWESAQPNSEDHSSVLLNSLSMVSANIAESDIIRPLVGENPGEPSVSRPSSILHDENIANETYSGILHLSSPELSESSTWPFPGNVAWHGVAHSVGQPELDLSGPGNANDSGDSNSSGRLRFCKRFHWLFKTIWFGLLMRTWTMTFHR